MLAFIFQSKFHVMSENDKTTEKNACERDTRKN